MADEKATLPQINKEIDQLTQSARSPQPANLEDREKSKEENIAQAIHLSAQMQSLLSKAEYSKMAGYYGLGMAGLQAAAEKLAAASASIPGAPLAGSAVGQMMAGFKERQRRRDGIAGMGVDAGGGVGRYSGGGAGGGIAGGRQGFAGTPSGAGVSNYADTTGGIIDRSKFKAELANNPELRKRVMAIAANENNNPQAQQAVIESMMNRALMRGTSLAAQARWLFRQGDGGYYDARKGNQRGYNAVNNPNTRAGLERRLEAALGGSNVANYGTGNASGSFVEGRIQRGMYSRTAKFGGESFVTEGGSQYHRWRQSLPKAQPRQLQLPGGGEFGGGGATGGIDQSRRAAGDARFSVVGNAAQHGANRDLVAAAQEASRYLPPGYRVEAFSGTRPGDKRFHGKGEAVDFAIYDAQGNKLANYQSPQNFRTYEKFAQDMHKALYDRNPSLAAGHRWGGYFGGQMGKVYGANDLMHHDFGLSHGVPMAAGSWEHGLNRDYRGVFDTRSNPSVGMGNVQTYGGGQPQQAGGGEEQAGGGGRLTGGITNQTINFIKAREGFAAKRYDDVSQQSIGYGTKARPGETTISREEAHNRLVQEIQPINDWINQNVKVPITPNQRTALTSLAFNVGTEYLDKLKDDINAKKWDTVYERMETINKVSGKYNEGIHRRRKLETALARAKQAPESFEEQGETGTFKTGGTPSGQPAEQATDRKQWPGEKEYKGPQRGLDEPAPADASRVSSERVFGGPETSTVRTFLRDAQGVEAKGSAFAIGGGYYLSAAHEYSRPSDIRFGIGREQVHAELIHKNKALDYAILKTSESDTARLKAAGMTDIELSREPVKEGTRLTAQGYSGPTGRYTTASGAMTGTEDFFMKYDNQISGVRDAYKISTEESMGYLRERMPGTSGGPVTREGGQAVGLVSGHGQRADEAAMFSPQMRQIIEDMPKELREQIPQLRKQQMIAAATKPTAPAEGAQGPIGGPQQQAAPERKPWPGEQPYHGPQKPLLPESQVAAAPAPNQPSQGDRPRGQPSQRDAAGQPSKHAERAREIAKGGRIPRLPGRSLAGVKPELSSRLAAMWRDAPASAKRGFLVRSGFRDYKTQARLYQKFLHGGNIAARPGHSRHESGLAVDLVDPSGWFHRHAAEYGLQYGVPSKGGKRIDLGHFQVAPGAKPVSPTSYTSGPDEIKKSAMRDKAEQRPEHETKEPQRPQRGPSTHKTYHHHPHQPKTESGKWAPKGPSASAHSHVREKYNKREHPLNYRLGDTA